MIGAYTYHLRFYILLNPDMALSLVLFCVKDCVKAKWWHFLNLPECSLTLHTQSTCTQSYLSEISLCNHYVKIPIVSPTVLTKSYCKDDKILSEYPECPKQQNPDLAFILCFWGEFKLFRYIVYCNKVLLYNIIVLLLSGFAAAVPNTGWCFARKNPNTAVRCIFPGLI